MQCRTLPYSCGFGASIIGFVGGVSTAYNFNSPSFSTALNSISNSRNLSGDSTWFNLSVAFKNVFGVYAFGFNANGTRDVTNYRLMAVSDAAEDEFATILQRLIYRYTFLDLGKNKPAHEWERHEDDVATDICTIGEAHCTIENVFCWMRRQPAPRQDGTYDLVANGQSNVLTGGNPIVTHVNTAGKTIINETRPGHILHDAYQSPGCGAQNPIPDRCSFVERSVSNNGQSIRITTRGEGYNPDSLQVLANEVGGETIFESVDEQKKWVKEVGSCATCTP